MNSDPQKPRIQVLDCSPLAVDCPACYAPAGCRCALILPVSVRILDRYHPARARLARWLRGPDAADAFIALQLAGYRNWLESQDLDKLP